MTKTAAQPKPVQQMQNATSAPTVGQQLTTSPAVRAAIAQLISELKAKSATLTDIRPPRADLKPSYDDLIARATSARGRGLLYPYIGSGIGNGALVELADGSVKWDMICGIGVHFFGHSDPDLAEAALISGLDDTLKHGNLSSGFEPYEFMETLLREAGKASKLKHCYLSTSGAMANENALKICYQKHAPAPRVIAFKDCFMGRSTTMAQIGDTPDYRQGLPLNVLVDYFPFFDEVKAQQQGLRNYIDAAAAQLTELLDRYPGQHAAFIFELVQGEGGFNVGNRDFFKALMDLCRARKVAIWSDEIQTFGRLPKMFAFEYFNLGEYIDVATIGKMTQSCATLWTEAMNPKGGLLSGTFTGEGVSFRMGQRVIDRLASGGYYGEHGLIAQHHAAFRAQVKGLAARHPQWFPFVPSLSLGAECWDVAGGEGGMMRFTPFGGVKDKINATCKACFEEGVILFYCGHGPYHIRLLPPLGVMKLDQWPRVFEGIERGLAKAAS
jgi:4-aminobutyrate aminotransferase-like enzyme